MKPIVLCIDDDPTVLESLRIELSQVAEGNFFLETAESGVEAIELLDELSQEQRPVAVAIADYIMPGMKGDELLRLIHERSPQTLNILLTGQADIAAVGRAVQYAKLYRYLTKPWQMSDFALTLTEALQSYQQQRLLEAHTQELEQVNQQIQALNQSLEQQVKQRTAELEEKMRELERSDQAKDNVLHAISHDLRTPLIGMLLVLENSPKAENGAIALIPSAVERITQSCQRQLKMLNTLLEVQAREVLGTVLSYQRVDLAELVRAIAEDLDLLVQQHQSQLIINSSFPSVWVDPDQLRRVFENLVTNALNHNPVGIEISMRSEPMAESPHLVRIWIEDNGVGIPVQDMATLFQRYSQATQVRRTPGGGLGLDLCRQIITAHGGEIGVQNRTERGTAFWFTVETYRPET
jgi:two-component system, sensor histidine kinase and response regulator